MAKPATVEDMTNDFVTKRFKLRGHRYQVTELSMAKYQKTLKQATKKDEDTEREYIDPETHNRILLGQCVKMDGKAVDVDDLYRDGGTRAIRHLLNVISDLHVGDEPEEDDDDDDAGEAPAEAKSSASAT